MIVAVPTDIFVNFQVIFQSHYIKPHRGSVYCLTVCTLRNVNIVSTLYNLTHPVCFNQLNCNHDMI